MMNLINQGVQDKMKIKDVITLDDNNKYVITSKVNYKEINYYYLTNINNPDELLFCYEDNNDLVEITDKNITTKLLPLFFKASEDYFNNN